MGAKAASGARYVDGFAPPTTTRVATVDARRQGRILGTARVGNDIEPFGFRTISGKSGAAKAIVGVRQHKEILFVEGYSSD